MVSQEIHCKKSLNTKTGFPPSECINSGRLLLLYQLKSYCIVLRNIVIEELVQTYSKHRVLIVLTSHFIHPNPHNFMPPSLIFILKSNKNKVNTNKTSSSLVCVSQLLLDVGPVLEYGQHTRIHTYH